VREVRHALPPGWIETFLGDISIKPEYGWTTSASQSGGKIKFLRTTDISSGPIDWPQVPYCAVAPNPLGRFQLRKGDLVISRAGSVGLSALINECPEAVFASYLIRFRPDEELEPKFVAYFLQSPRYWQSIRERSAGIALQNVNAKKLSSISLPIAPKSEQSRIVAEIEKQFTRLDAAVAALNRVQANLKRYRAAVLRAACEGRLVPTEAERADKEGRSYETGEQLLARILKERRVNWEATQLAKIQTTGKPPKNDEWKKKYKEAKKQDIKNLAKLPNGWTWATWEQIGFSQNGRAFPSAQYCEEGVKLLRPGNLHVSGRVQWTEENTRYMPAKWEQDNPDLVVDSLELVMNLTAQSLRDEFLGRICITSIDEHCLLNQRLARLTPVIVDRRFLLWLLKSPIFRRFVDGLNTGSLIQHMFTSQLARFPMPLPPLPEQGRIAAEVEARLSIIEHNEDACEKGLRRIDVLRQSILKRAFEGKLVPQDSHDEPALVLLERIRAERAADKTKTGIVAHKKARTAATT
jgi:type I restriction enzyme S subunit